MDKVLRRSTDSFDLVTSCSSFTMWSAPLVWVLGQGFTARGLGRSVSLRAWCLGFRVGGLGLGVLPSEKGLALFDLEAHVGDGHIIPGSGLCG